MLRRHRQSTGKFKRRCRSSPHRNNESVMQFRPAHQQFPTQSARATHRVENRTNLAQRDGPGVAHGGPMTGDARRERVSPDPSFGEGRGVARSRRVRALSPGRTPVGHPRLTPPARPVRVSGPSTWGACAAAPPPRSSPGDDLLTWHRRATHRICPAPN